MNVPKYSENEENVAKVSNKCVIDSVPKYVPRSRSGSSCHQDMFLSDTNSIHLHSILDHITTIGGKNALHCLDLLHNYALRAAVSNFASKVEISPNDRASSARTKILGPLDMSKPYHVHFRVKDILEPVFSSFPNSLNEPNDLSKAENKVVAFSRRKKMTSFSDKSASSDSATSFQGTLQCSWKDGMPYFVFHVDYEKEVYAASMSKTEPSGNMGFDYVYTFCSRIIGKEGLDGREFELFGLCTMKVSTKIMLCPNSSSEIKETRFVLSLSGEDPYYRKRSRGLVSKVAKVFRSSHSYKQKQSCEYRGSSALLEDSTWDPCERTENISENDYTPNLDVAAIIVKDTLEKSSSKEDSIGGWGLKFLKKSGMDVSPNVKCSTTLDVLIPAGVHSWPKTGGGGPSGLVERWVSGGVCDCGSWDLGCPLTVLNMGPGGPNSSSLVDCKSVDLFIKGSKRDVPMLQMTAIREGSYRVHFQPRLTTLQSFAIAAAIIHRSKTHGT